MVNLAQLATVSISRMFTCTTEGKRGRNSNGGCFALLPKGRLEVGTALPQQPHLPHPLLIWGPLSIWSVPQPRDAFICPTHSQPSSASGAQPRSELLTIVLLAVLLHVNLVVALGWFAVGVTVCKRRTVG